MKIKSLSIDGIGGIQHLELSFIDGINVICGANGIGKTTILDVIADAFTNERSKLKRNALCKEGKYNIEIDTCINGNCTRVLRGNTVEDFLPYNGAFRNGWAFYSKDLLKFGINRNIAYVNISLNYS